MKLRAVYAVRGSNAWLVDTCAGGTWSEVASDAVTFTRSREAVGALAAAELAHGPDGETLQIVLLVEERRAFRRD